MFCRSMFRHRPKAALLERISAPDLKSKRNDLRIIFHITLLTLWHSERPNIYANLAFLSAIGLKRMLGPIIRTVSSGRF